MNAVNSIANGCSIFIESTFLLMIAAHEATIQNVQMAVAALLPCTNAEGSKKIEPAMLSRRKAIVLLNASRRTHLVYAVMSNKEPNSPNAFARVIILVLCGHIFDLILYRHDFASSITIV